MSAQRPHLLGAAEQRHAAAGAEVGGAAPVPAPLPAAGGAGPRAGPGRHPGRLGSGGAEQNRAGREGGGDGRLCGLAKAVVCALPKEANKKEQ